MQSKFKSMRKIFVTVILALFATTLVAQDYNSDQEKKIDFGFDVFYDFWQNMPDSMGSNGLSLGTSIYAMYEKQIWTEDGRYRLALGAGITTHKLSSNSYLDSLSYAPARLKSLDNIDYKKSTIVVTYLDFMAELRYKSPSKFRFAVGAKIGFRIGSHTKYNGEGLEYDQEGLLVGTGIDEKVIRKDVQFLERMRFGPTLKIGYGFLNLNVYYSLSKLFSEENGPELYPISVGLTFNPF